MSPISANKPLKHPYERLLAGSCTMLCPKRTTGLSPGFNPAGYVPLERVALKGRQIQKA